MGALERVQCLCKGVPLFFAFHGTTHWKSTLICQALVSPQADTSMSAMENVLPSTSLLETDRWHVAWGGSLAQTGSGRSFMNDVPRGQSSGRSGSLIRV